MAAADWLIDWMIWQDKPSVHQNTESSDISAKLEKVEELERQIEDQKFKISQLREEKVLYLLITY